MASASSRAASGPGSGRLRLGVPLGQALLAGARRAHVVDGEVGRDPADPGAERPPQLESVERAPGAQERLLGDVVGQVVGAHDPQGHAVHPALVEPHDLLEGARVSPPRPGDQERLIRPHHLPGMIRPGARIPGSAPATRNPGGWGPSAPQNRNRPCSRRTAEPRGLRQSSPCGPGTRRRRARPRRPQWQSAGLRRRASRRLSYSRMRITTRRFWARSSLVLFSATGFSSP